MSYRDMRGDNLHNMMIDPTTVNARVYVGNIPTSEVSRRDVEERFQKYGPILGVSLNRGFGFVQFEHESHAAEAIKNENGVMFRGKKIEVNAARVYGGARSRGGGIGGGGGGGGGSDGPSSRKGDLEDRDPFRDRSPIDDRGRDRDWRDRDRYDSFGGKGNMERGNMDRGNMDRGNMDRGNMDRGNMDRGNMDRGNMDRGNMDRGNMDRGNMDRGNMDRGNMDRGNMDRGNMDRGNMDRGNMDRGNMDRGNMDRGNMDRGNMDRSNIDRGNIDRGNIDRGNIDRGNIDRGNIDRGNIDRGNMDRGNMDRSNFFSGRGDNNFGKDSGSFSNQEKFRGGSNIGPGRDDNRGNSFGKEPFGPGSFRPPAGISDNRPNIPPRDYVPANNAHPLERTNDCEIIVFNKEQREYAEYIEMRLKQLDMTVDLLFPNEEVPISRILSNISSRGTLFAISVMPQNEEHRSLTLNILHGMPQEHRNMPMEDAVPLIKRNFDVYRTGEKAVSAAIPTAVAVAPAGTPATTSDRHPEAIQVLLGLLADNRQLTVLQYDRVLQYLQDRREVQLKLELGDAKDLPTSKEPATKQQVDLQHRILNILNNQSSATSASGVSGVGMPSAASGLGLSTTTAPSLGLGVLGSAGMGLGGMMVAGQLGAAGLGPPLNIGPVPAPVAPPSGNWQSQSSTSTPLLSDPTVQKALDSLMQGNLLRKITPTTGSSTPSISSLGSVSQPLFMGSTWGSGASKM